MEEERVRGVAFEREIAYLLQDAGLSIESLEPHVVIREGTKVGDIDIIARDPMTDTKVAVSCKEWIFTSPGVSEFSKFVIMLQVEGFKVGILASASKFKKSIKPLVNHYHEQGYTIALLGGSRIRELHEHKIRGEKKAIERTIRNMLNLPLEKPEPIESMAPPPPPQPTSAREIISGILTPILTPSEETAPESTPFILRARESLIASIEDSECLLIREVADDEEEEEEIGNEVHLTNQRLIIVNRESGLFSEKVEVALEMPLKGIQAVNQMSRGLFSKTTYLTIPYHKGKRKTTLAFSVPGQTEAAEWHDMMEQAIQSG